MANLFDLFLFFSVISTFFQVSLGQSDKVQAFVFQVETSLVEMARTLEDQYDKRCTQQCSQTHESCSDNLPTFECSKNYSTPTCPQKGEYSGKYVNLTHSTVKTPNYFYPYPNPTDQNSSEILCAASKIDQQFIQMKSIIPEITFQYFGTYTGFHINWPGRQRCNIYDPRLRDWYTDVSGSMNNNNKIVNAKNALNLLIQGLSIHDTVGLVVFSDNARKLTPKIIRANKVNKDYLLGLVREIVADGLTNYEDAFQSAYTLLQSGINDELGNGCENVFIFLSDGKPTVGLNTTDALINLMTENSKNLQIRYFLYGFGSSNVESADDIDKTLLQKISCAFNGIFQHIRDSSNLLVSISSYNQLISIGIKENKVYWTEPYEDANGRGQVITAAVVVLDQSISPPFVLGAIGVDFQLTKFYQLMTDNEIRSTIFTKGRECSQLDLSFCQMESLRAQVCQSTPSPSVQVSCPAIPKQPKFCNNLKPNPFLGTKYNSIAYEEIQGCCSVEKNTTTPNDTSQISNSSTTLVIQTNENDNNENDNTTYIVVIVVLVGVILFGIAGYFIYKQFQKSQQNIKPPVSLPIVDNPINNQDVQLDMQGQNQPQTCS